MVVIDAPTLFESGADRLCGAVVSVTAPEAFRLERILRTGPFGTGGGGERRMDAQKEEAYCTERSDYILVNDGSVKDLEEKARQLARHLQEKAGG